MTDSCLRCGGILAHSFFPFFFLTVLFNFIEGCRCIAFVYAQLSCYSISSGWGLRFDSAIATPRFFLSFSSYCVADLMLCCQCPLAQLNFSQALADSHMASPFTQWLQSFQVRWLQKYLKSSNLHHHASQLVWAACADVLCLVFA